MHPLLARLGLDIPDDLLHLALSHPSAVGEGLERTLKSNQRLEFLGDSLVGAIVASHFYRAEPMLPEGELTSRKIACVRRDALANAARRIGLGAHLQFGRGEGVAGGAERDSNLSDAFEALIGALFLAQGFEATRDFVLKVLEPELNADPASLVPAKSRLQELSQAAGVGHAELCDGAGLAQAALLFQRGFSGSGARRARAGQLQKSRRRRGGARRDCDFERHSTKQR